VARRSRAEKFYARGALERPRAARSTRTLDIVMSLFRELLVIGTMALAFPTLVTADSQQLDATALKNGLNYVDFTGDGVKDLIVVAHRSNFNAHGYDAVSFYTQAALDSDNSFPEDWHIIPLTYGGQEHLNVLVSGGANCVLHDFRLIASTGTVILADRDFGEDFGDPQAVTFTYLNLVKNVDGTPGWPAFGFEVKRTLRSKASYCDVGDAFIKELGISVTRR
jgi:hypothetical protein